MALFSSTESKRVSDLGSSHGASSVLTRSLSSSQLTGYPIETVFLNVYDLHEATSFLAPLGCGLFHAGIEVHGREFHYGRTEGGCGIGENPPRLCHPHVFREQFVLGVTPLTRFRVEEMLEKLNKDPAWDGTRYHLVHHNCLHFAQRVAQALLPVACRVAFAPTGSSSPIFYVGGTTETVVIPATGDGRGGGTALSSTQVQLPSLIPSHVDRLSRLFAKWAPKALVEKIDRWDRMGGS